MTQRQMAVRSTPGAMALAAIGPLVLCHLILLSACCVKPSEAIERHGEPDVIYELRGATGRWYWYGDEPPPRATRPDQLGLIWLEQNHQATFVDGCQTYDGPLTSADWRRFEQARAQQARLDRADRVPADADPAIKDTGAP